MDIFKEFLLGNSDLANIEILALFGHAMSWGNPSLSLCGFNMHFEKTRRYFSIMDWVE